MKFNLISFVYIYTVTSFKKPQLAFDKIHNGILKRNEDVQIMLKYLKVFPTNILNIFLFMLYNGIKFE